VPFSYPVFLEVDGQPCVVVGGGPETLQKTRPLVEQGARVLVIAPAPVAGLAELAAAHPARLTVEQRPYRDGDLAGCLLCIAATGDQALNARVFAEARRERVLINAVDDNQHCQFATPSQVRRGDLVIAIGTGGRAPALAKWLRQELAERYGEEYGETAALIGEVRAEARGRWSSFSGWARRWEAILDDQVVELVRAGRHAQARALLLDRLNRPGDEDLRVPPDPDDEPAEL
jgi:siroheme synthase-like protein